MAERERTTRDQFEWLLDLFRRAKRYWMLVGAVFVLGAALSLTLAMGKKPQYESEVVLLYQEMISQSVLQGRDVVKSSRSLSSRYKEMVYSRSQLRKIVEKFNLVPGQVASEGMVAATETLRQRIVFRDNGTGTFRIVYRGDTRETARDVAKMLGELLIEEDNRVRQIQAKTTVDFLVAKKTEAEDSLRESERGLAEFLAEHPEFAEETMSAAAGAAIRVSQGDKKNGTTVVRSGDAQLAALLRQRSRTKALLDNPNAKTTVAPSRTTKTPERIAAERAVSQAQRNLETARAKLAAAKAKYTDVHPDVRAAKAAVASAESDVAAKKAALPPLEEEGPKEVAVDRVALQKQLAELDRAIAARRRQSPSGTPRPPPKPTEVESDLVKIEALWTKLMRQVAEGRERVERLESRVFTADITASSEFANASQLTVIDEAFLPPTPAGRSRKLVAMAGAFFFGLLGLAVALGLALVDDRLFRSRELEAASSLPVLVVIPDSKLPWWRKFDPSVKKKRDAGG